MLLLPEGGMVWNLAYSMFTRILYVQIFVIFNYFFVINCMHFKSGNSDLTKYITLDLDKCIVSQLDKHNYYYK